MRISRSIWTILIATLLVCLVGGLAWREAPLGWKNMLLSQIHPEFYKPVYVGDMDELFRGSPLTIEFSPGFYGEYAFELGTKGTMKNMRRPRNRWMVPSAMTFTQMASF